MSGTWHLQEHPRTLSLFHFGTSRRTSFCSFDGHSCIVTDHDAFPIPPEHRPPCVATEFMCCPLPNHCCGCEVKAGSGVSEQGTVRPRATSLLACPAYRPVAPLPNKNFFTLKDAALLSMRYLISKGGSETHIPVCISTCRSFTPLYCTFYSCQSHASASIATLEISSLKLDGQEHYDTMVPFT